MNAVQLSLVRPLRSIHIGDADATKLDSFVASGRRCDRHYDRVFVICNQSPQLPSVRFLQANIFYLNCIRSKIPFSRTLMRQTNAYCLLREGDMWFVTV